MKRSWTTRRSFGCSERSAAPSATPVLRLDHRIGLRAVGLLELDGGDPDALRLQPPRDAHRRAAVAQVVADLAGDERRRVGAEGHAAGGVEAVGRLDQADGADLREVVERLLAPA